MSLRSPVRSLLVAGLASWIVLGTALTDGHAQTPPIPPIPGGLPGIPGIPGAPSAPFPIPTSLPAPGATPGIPSIPGIPGLKLFSPTGSLLMPVMKEETKKIYQREKDALPADRKAIVADIPLLTDPDKTEINAFAGCDDAGKTFVVVTEGLYQVVDLMVNARATDETFGTSYYDQYVRDLAAQQEGKAQILPLPPGMLDPTKSLDARKIKRQKQLFDESMAYVVGHELAHHYMGHLGSSCSGGGGGTLKPGDLVRVLRKVMPAINQASELQADIEGTKNMLDAGQSDPEYKWTEGGALLVIDFFKKLRDLHPGAVLFTFMSTHPAPELRAPIVKGTANAWRVTHPGSSAPPAGPADTTGAKLPIPLPPGMSLPLPMPSGLPMPPTPK